MSGPSTPINVLISEHRLYEARQRLQLLRTSNARVYGLDADIEMLDSAIQRADSLASEANDLMDRGDARHACARYREVLAIAADHPHAESRLHTATLQHEQARFFLSLAQERARDGKIVSALDAVNESLVRDCTSATANNLRQLLKAELTAAEIDGRRKRRMTIAGSIGAVAAMALVAAGTHWLVMEYRDRELRNDVMREIATLMADAEAAVAVEEYSTAQSLLENALSHTRDLKAPDAVSAKIRAAMESPQITHGLAGLVPMG